MEKNKWYKSGNFIWSDERLKNDNKPILDKCSCETRYGKTCNEVR